MVELHTALTQQAHKTGITDEQLLVDNARMSSELESSQQRCRECERLVAMVDLMGVWVLH